MPKIANIVGVATVAIFALEGCKNDDGNQEKAYDGNLEKVTKLYEKYAGSLKKAAAKEHGENVCDDLKKECDEKVDKLSKEDGEKDRNRTFNEKSQTAEQRSKDWKAFQDAEKSFAEAYDQCIEKATKQVRHQPNEIESQIGALEGDCSEDENHQFSKKSAELKRLLEACKSIQV